MTSSLEELKTLVKKYTLEQEHEVCVRTDKSFRTLFCVQWVFGILVALTLSPQAWSGPQSQIHIHLWNAILLGGAIAGLPILLATFRAGTKLSRYTIACCQMLFGGLLIHLMGGRIEAHFYVFGSLAFLSTYRQWQILIPATLIVALDHVVRGIYWPLSVYGTATGAEWRWLEHAGWVIFEDIFLIISIVQGKSDMWKIAKTRANLEVHNSYIEELVQVKADELKNEQAVSLNSARMAALGEIAGGIAHEVNTPLGAILLSSQTLKSQLESGEIDRAHSIDLTDNIEKTVNRISKIIRALRAFTRGANNDPFLDTSIVSIIENALALSAEKLRARSIDVRFDRPEGSELTVQCRESQIGQVLINLINNARDAIEHLEEKWVAIQIEERPKEIAVLFSDSGPGIPPEIEEKIFKPFFTTKEVGKGTGLGLSISKEIIESHGGALKLVRSKRNTTFEIILPKLQANQAFDPFEEAA